MTLASWLSLLAISFLGAMSPGPSLAMVVRHTLGGGRAKGIICAWAHSIGIGIYALLTLLGLAALLKHAPLVFNGIALIGGLYLAWIGIQALRSKGGMADKLAAGENTSALVAARDGIAISLFNPKIILFFVALFSQFVMGASTGTGQSLIVLTPMIVDGLWYTFIALVLSHGAILPKLRAKAGLIDKISGVVLILLAIRVWLTL
ncbi:LysE family translocator [uncultured Shewanella sp.]|uniref:LysE family translocator n=1 Tax=uncultured Shewanella sp. TaxID=173975 RepID=UPI00262C76B1|nr:LysE family translocator [uncultured Shewanella sp.]